MLYKNIQGLRAVAALMVVWVHFYGHWLEPIPGAVGPGGVDLFFVISGFVVFLAADRLGKKAEIAGRWRSFREFAVKRVFRIYPVYWVAFGVASLLMTTVDLGSRALPQKPWWELALLINSPNNRILAAWTLQYEMIFYSVCALAILVFPRRILVVLALWFAVVFYVWVADIQGFPTYLIPIVLEFSFGIAVALMAERKIAGYALPSLVLGVVGFAVGATVLKHNGGWGLPPMWRVSCIGLPSAFIVYGCVALEIRKAWTFPKPLVRLGDASYSLYLWHQLLYAVMVAVFVSPGYAGMHDQRLLWVFSVPIALTVGFASFYLIERPINKSAWVARLAGVEPKKPSAAPLTVTAARTEAIQQAV